jgi:alanine racemase
LKAVVGPGVQVLGVVKADAYGHGAVPVARALQEAGVDWLGVALAAEGAELREAGIGRPVLVMGPLFQDEVEDLLAYGLTPTLSDLASAEALAGRLSEAGLRVPEPAEGPPGDGRLACHLKVDTGMNRLGVRAEDAARRARQVASLGRLSIEAVYTHFACAECAGDPSVAEQLRRFEAALTALRSAGLAAGTVHAANSSALLSLPASHYSMVRPGLALYGVDPRGPGAGGAALEPALTLATRLAGVKRVARGEGVSYGHTWRAARDSVVGILPIGYGDGYPRALSNRGQVRVAGRLCPVVGAVCMDATMVDLTALLPGAGLSAGSPESDLRALLGAEVALIEADNASPLSAYAVARVAGTIAYELLTGLSRRVPRVYVP